MIGGVGNTNVLYKGESVMQFICYVCKVQIRSDNEQPNTVSHSLCEPCYYKEVDRMDQELDEMGVYDAVIALGDTGGIKPTVDTIEHIEEEGEANERL